MYRRATTLSAIIFVLALGAGLLMSAKTIGTSAQTPKDQTRSTYKWERSDDGLRMRVELRGKVEFTEDYSDIRDVAEGGFVRIEEDRYGQSRRYEVRRDANGELRRTYYLNGDVHPLDQEARNWLAKIVLNAVRQSGIDADKRVQTIMHQRGLT